MSNVKYEYKIIKMTGLDNIQEELNKLSKDGWELVAVVEERHYFRKIIPNVING